MKGSVIYTDTLEEMHKGTRRIIHQGGQYSGKTVNVLGALAHLASEDEGYGITTVTSMSMPHLKGGALRDFESYVYPTFKNAIKQYHRTEHTFTFKSGHIMEFKAFDDEFKARGGKRKRLFVNEANKFDRTLFFQLDSRSDQTIIDYNPTVRFWAHEEFIGFPDTVTFYSDHRHNPFISAQKHAEIEKICEFEKDEEGKIIFKNGQPVIKRGDFELWKVYARGITGNVTGVIFPDWEIIDNSLYPDDDGSEVYSIDFGYTNDPTALVKIKRIGETLYIKELAYETGLAPIEIARILKENGFDPKRQKLWCEHDPDMIYQLRNKVGITYADFARKGQGSVNAGIELLRRYKVKYTHSSRNIHKERGMYVWETDKVTGKLTNMPIDSNNHTFDAIRYGAYSTYLRAA